MRELTDEEVVRVLEMHDAGRGFIDISKEFKGTTPNGIKTLCEEAENGEVVVPAPNWEVHQYHSRKGYRPRVTTKRSSVGLRDKLFDTMDQLLNGEIDTFQAQAVAKLSDAICRTVRMDMEADRMRRNDVIDVGGPTPIQLGREDED